MSTNFTTSAGENLFFRKPVQACAVSVFLIVSSLAFYRKAALLFNAQTKNLHR
ncbi:hypothetical protein ACFSUI_13805 [Ralstonia solanacearum]